MGSRPRLVGKHDTPTNSLTIVRCKVFIEAHGSTFLNLVYFDSILNRIPHPDVDEPYEKSAILYPVHR